MEQDRQSQLGIGVRCFELAERQTGNVGQIGGDQRQHTGRRKGEDPGSEGNPISYVRGLMQAGYPFASPLK